jgi:DNA-binding transcriptional regulator YiaG
MGNICAIILSKAEGILLMDKEAIRELRRKLGLSQEGLARKLGVSVLTVRRWEKGSFRPSPLAMARIEEIAQRKKIKDEPV